MSRGLNKVMVIGNLGGDPETKFMPSGTQLTTFSIGVTDTWKDKQTGEQKDRTEWVNAEAWGRLAEIAAEYLHKGALVFIEGSMKTDKWDDAESGKKMYRTKVRVDQMTMLGKSEGGAQQRQEPPKPQSDDFEDDIPF